MVEIQLPHDLLRIIVVSKCRANYVCRCGARGTATKASHLGSFEVIVMQAFKNHELHATRRYVKTIRNKMLAELEKGEDR